MDKYSLCVYDSKLILMMDDWWFLTANNPTLGVSIGPNGGAMGNATYTQTLMLVKQFLPDILLTYLD